MAPTTSQRLAALEKALPAAAADAKAAKTTASAAKGQATKATNAAKQAAADAKAAREEAREAKEAAAAAPPAPDTPAPAPTSPATGQTPPDPAPTPADPAPQAPAGTPVPPVTGDGKARVLALVTPFGVPVPDRATVIARGGAVAQHEARFDEWGNKQWAAEGDKWEGDYYGREKLFYVAWARGAGDQWLARAHALAVSYRDRYVLPNTGGLPAHWTLVEGLAIHYALTGDEKSRTAVGLMADALAAPYYLEHIGDHAGNPEMDARQPAKCLLAFDVAAEIGAPSAAGRDWRALSALTVDRILAAQDADGAWRYQVGGTTGCCGWNKPWMSGMLCSALLHHSRGEQAPAVAAAVVKAARYLVTKNVTDGGRAVMYLEGVCGADGPGAAPDLNHLVTPAVAFAAWQTKDAALRTACDLLLAGANATTNISGSKNFNQLYTESHVWLAYRLAVG